MSPAANLSPCAWVLIAWSPASPYHPPVRHPTPDSVAPLHFSIDFASFAKYLHIKHTC
jgi:hypothetical protein